MNLFGRKSGETLIAENNAACQRDGEIMEQYIQAMDSGKRPTLTSEQLQAHLQEASKIEDTRNALIERSYHRSGGVWERGK